MNNLTIVIVFVGGVLVLGLAGIVGLSLTDHAIPDVLQNVTVGALTALVGLLVKPGAEA